MVKTGVAVKSGEVSPKVDTPEALKATVYTVAIATKAEQPQAA